MTTIIIIIAVAVLAGGLQCLHRKWDHDDWPASVPRRVHPVV